MSKHYTFDYNPKWPFNKGHFNTIYANLSGRRLKVGYSRIRLNTPDGDFVDVDTLANNTNSLIITGHGLEGSASSTYMVRMVAALSSAGHDVWAINWRSCSGIPNLKLQSYHSGFTDDLSFILEKALAETNYENIFLIGFSLGGNILMKYLGETGAVNNRLKGAVAISVPCHLESVSYQLDKTTNKIYMMRFMRSLKRKTRLKKEMFPDAPFSLKDIEKAQNFHDFDNLYTAPVHGFRSAEDYWQKSSSRQFIPGINTPTLLLNAANDPFLTPMCFPKQEAAENPNFQLEIQNYGGHAGFMLNWKNETGTYYTKRAIEFIGNLQTE